MLVASGCASIAAPIRPLVIAHRGGKENWPENTLYAFEEARKVGVKAIELDVQVTRDGIPVLYHPTDLSQWTDGAGNVGDHTFQQIRTLNAAWKYGADKSYPYRAKNLRIPTLVEVLQAIPDIPVIVDMKSLPEEKLVAALLKHIPESEWKRLTFYSTNEGHLVHLKKGKPDAIMFEPRKMTRVRLLHSIHRNVATCRRRPFGSALSFDGR